MENKEDIIIKLGLLFYFCSIFGYIYELILHFFNKGIIFSCGILNGPWLPIYGVGSILIITLYKKYHNKPLIIFILSFFLTGILELISGFILDKIIHKRLWDYSKRFLNINGYVCLLSAFCFGIGGLIIIYLIYPFIKKVFNNFTNKALKIILITISIIFALDIILTIINM